MDDLLKELIEKRPGKTTGEHLRDALNKIRRLEAAIKKLKYTVNGAIAYCEISGYHTLQKHEPEFQMLVSLRNVLNEKEVKSVKID